MEDTALAEKGELERQMLQPQQKTRRLGFKTVRDELQAEQEVLEEVEYEQESGDEQKKKTKTKQKTKKKTDGEWKLSKYTTATA